jgi:glucose/arabinose dehydrogenase
VNFTDLEGDTHLVEYEWREGRADASTRRELLFVDQPYPNHNGGDLAFGPDGFLYVGLGDGGSDYSQGDPQGDPERNGQNLGVLLAKMLRIQPRLPDGSVPSGPDAYAIPPDNPFVDTDGARPEIWAWGLRNPWRFSFDRETGDLWIADVGAGDREEVDRQPADSTGGENYGWNAMEGTFQWRKKPRGAVPPVFDYFHDNRCAVVGGFVYRGTDVPELEDKYVFGDYCAGELVALTPRAGRAADPLPISEDIVTNLVAFGEDADGELYALSLDGPVYRLVAAGT